MPSYISPSTLKSWLHDSLEIALLDVREHGQYGASHLFYATPLPYSRLEQDITRLVPRRHVRTVVYDSGDETTAHVAERAARRLTDLGYTHVSVLDGGTKAWHDAGYQLFAGVNLPSKAFGELAERAYHTPRITAHQLAAKRAEGTPLVILDGRPVSEFRKMNIPGATCCPNGELAYRIHSLVPDETTPIVINCAGRTRSIIGAQTLINLELPNPVYALENGTQGWYLADFKLEHGGTRRYADNSGNAALQKQAKKLARDAQVSYVDAATVKSWVQDANRTLFLCDVRTPEEFHAGTLAGAQHTPGGQLIQASDQYMGVRGARLVLFDNDGIRAPVVASWLRQMGHEAHVLIDGLDSGLTLHTQSAPQPPDLPRITVTDLTQRLQQQSVAVVDLRSGMQYRSAHIPGARWSTRPHMVNDLAHEARLVVLVADDEALARWAATELPNTPLLLAGGMQAWQQAGLPTQASPNCPSDDACIDYLFFVHDRHDGNKDAARQYLAWETGLVSQLDELERSAFRLPAGCQ